MDKTAVVADDAPVTSSKPLRYGLACLLAASGLYGFSLLLHPTSNAGATPAVDCVSVQSAVVAQLPPTTTTTFHTGIAPWSAGGPTRQQWLTAIHLVINNPQCFDPTVVAAAQAGLDGVAH